MKNHDLFIKILVLAPIIAAVVLTGLSLSCKNPEDENPPGDTLLWAPASPQLIAPPDSYNYMTEGTEIYYTIRWESIDTAQAYELSLNDHTIVLDSNSFLGNIDQAHFGEIQWSVRAASAVWKTGFTAWSDTQVFYTSHPPMPPSLATPPYDAQIVSDSVTAHVGFEWGPVTRAQLYEFEVYYDSALIYSISLPQLWDSVYLDDTGRYEWRVRAGSGHWQMPGQWSDLWPFTVVRP